MIQTLIMFLNLLRICCLLGSVGAAMTGRHAYIHGYLLVMMSEEQRFDMYEGQTLNLVCDFQADNYNLFDYPVLWKKTQHHEEHQINIMGNLNHPFVNTKRFSVSFSQTAPVHRLELIISDVSPEDSGNYTCEIRGPESVVLTSVTHRVFVKAPIRNLTMFVGNSSGDSNLGHDDSSSALKHGGGGGGGGRKTIMIENTQNSVRCVAHGGFPAPEIKMKLDRDDITPQFHFETRPMLTGEPGLRIITYTTEVWTNDFVPSASDDEQKLKCVVYDGVTKQRTNTTFIKLEVHYSPKIKCYDLEVAVGESNPVLRCTVMARPEVTHLSWIIDENGTVVAGSDVVDDHWIINSDTENQEFETQLFMRTARRRNFRTYTVVADNGVAASTEEVTLSELIRTTTTMPPGQLARGEPSPATTFHNIFTPFNGGPCLTASLWTLALALSLVLVNAFPHVTSAHR